MPMSTQNGTYWWPRRKQDGTHRITGASNDQALGRWVKFDGRRGILSPPVMIDLPETEKWPGNEDQERSSAEADRNLSWRKSKSRTESHMQAIPLHHQPAKDASQKIYILGTGAIAKFVAQSLTSIGDPPPITLLSYSRNTVEEWHQMGDIPGAVNDNKPVVASKIDLGHEAAAWPPLDNDQTAMDQLIITTGANVTVTALLAMRCRFSPSSTICFLQNGMGIIEEVNEKVFPNPATRPRYLVGVAAHNFLLKVQKPSSGVDNRAGKIYLSLVPNDIRVSDSGDGGAEEHIERRPLVRRMYYGWNASSKSLMRSLTRCSALGATGFHFDKMLQLQFHKLAVNAVMGSLSVLFDCNNGTLATNSAITAIARKILVETVTVIHSLPEIRDMAKFKTEFTAERLEVSVSRVAARSKNNLTSMLQQFRNGRRTEIDSINGYIVKRGLEMGIQCPVNSIVLHMVKAKEAIVRRNEEALVPFR